MVVSTQQPCDPSAVQVRVLAARPERQLPSFLRRIERRIDADGQLRVLFLLDNFEPRDEEVAWEEIKAGFRHFQDVSRIALVGDTRWHERIGRFCKGFPNMASRYFSRENLDDARRWITSPVQVA